MTAPLIVRRRLLLCLSLMMVVVSSSFGTLAVAQDAEEPLEWIYGPAECRLGSVAVIDVPEGMQFVDGRGAQVMLEWMGNVPSGAELGIVTPLVTEDSGGEWFVIFEYDPMGYVRDDDKDDLDADGLLESFQEGTEEANKYRRENGWPEVHVEGWQTPPYYDSADNNLVWSIIGVSGTGRTVNYSTRLLGRGGAMSADLVLDMNDLGAVLPEYRGLLAGFSFAPGNTYAEYREGDKIAKYGLSALVAGGLGAAALKSGLFARFWKIIVFGGLAVLSFFRRAFGKLIGRGEKTTKVEPIE